MIPSSWMVLGLSFGIAIEQSNTFHDTLISNIEVTAESGSARGGTRPPGKTYTHSLPETLHFSRPPSNCGWASSELKRLKKPPREKREKKKEKRSDRNVGNVIGIEAGSIV